MGKLQEEPISIWDKMTRSQIIWTTLAGLVISVDNVISVVAFSSIIYQGVLAQFVPIVISILAVSAILISLSNMFLSSKRYAIAQLQDEAAILYSSMALVIIHSMPTNAPNMALFVTVLLCIGITTLLTGFIFYCVGKFELANIIRYLPYPVNCGFLAATGWLLLSGTFSLMVGQSLQQDWLIIFQPQIIMYWLPGFIAGFFVFFCKEKLGYQYALQVTFISLIVLFYAFLYGFHIDYQWVSAEGFLLGPFSQNNMSALFQMDFSQLAYFPMSKTLINYMGLVILVSFIALLLNASSLELLAHEPVDLNKELRTAGIGNMFSGLVGGIVGYLSLTATALAKEQGKSRFTGIVAVIPLVAILTFGTDVIEFLPKVAIGCFLFYMAFSFLSEWLIDTWYELNVSEYLFIVLIFVIAIFFNMLTAVAVGTVFSIFHFAFRYSQVNPVKNLFSGATYHSSFEREPTLKAILLQHGNEILYLKLQGFLFFGSVYKLYNLIKNSSNVRYIILDFELVNNIDSSRITLIKYLKDHAVRNRAVYAICNLKPNLREELIKTELFHSDSKWVKLFSDREAALGWCEEQLLKKYSQTSNSEVPSLKQQLRYIGFSAELAECIQKNAKKTLYRQNEQICEEGEQTTSFYFIHRGQVSVFVGRNRLLTVGAGNVLGEISMYAGNIRSATLRTNEETVIYEMDIGFLQTLAEENPQLLGQFHLCIARILAKRVVEQNERIRMLDSEITIG